MRVRSEQAETPSTPSALRHRAAVGTVYLTLRRALGIVLAFGGLVFLTRLVGPSVFGVYTAAMGIVVYLSLIGQMGIRVYLIRYQEGHLEQALHQAFSWLSVAGSSLTILSLGALGLLWFTSRYDWDFLWALASLVAALPFTLIAQVPGALLERQLEYKRTALVELTAQLLYYIVAVPMAIGGYGIWAFLAGYWAQTLTTTGGLFWAARYRPRWYWAMPMLRPMLSYSVMQALSGWLYELRSLAPGLVLLPLAGAESVGYYALAQRALQMLGVIKDAVSRISVPIYALVQDQTDKLLVAISRSAQAQVLGLGVACLLFATGGKWLLPTLFGSQWDIPIALLIFAFLASEQLLNAIFGAQAQALYVKRHNLVIVKVNALFIGIFFTLTTLAAWTLPQHWKSVGFAMASATAHLPNNWIYHRVLPRYIGRPHYRMSVTWALTLSIALFAPVVSYWLLLVLVVFLLPSSLRELRSLRQELGSSHLQNR